MFDTKIHLIGLLPYSKRRVLSFIKPLLFTITAGAISLVVLIPIYLMVVTGFKDKQEVVTNPLGLPDVYVWENFSTAWEGGNFGRYFINSILVTTPTVIGVLVFSTLAAYAFALLSFPGKEKLFSFFLGGLTIPLGVLSIPLFYLMNSLKLLDTHWALILPEIGISMPFGILLLRSFIQDLPKEILDAGRIDGCTDWGLLRHIVIPLSRPAIFSLLIFNFTWSWNEFLLAVVLLQTEAARTLPLGLNFFRGRYSSNYPLLMAGATLTFIPVMIVYILFQRHFIKGIVAGSVSGS